ncbi:hypothetical protein [Amycolatopsis sp. NPDC059657]|uniref:DUF7352 domain-containing protein n=1 Tax=Amycolatopsis sp. NPDC059657 TaxID=3346899 RepID=UPI00366C0F99
MATTIHRYRLKVVDEQTVPMPAGAEVLHVAHRPWSQLPDIDVWARVDSSQPDTPRTFRIAGTGHPLDDRPHHHLGSALLPGQHAVFHVFEILSSNDTT